MNETLAWLQQQVTRAVGGSVDYLEDSVWCSCHRYILQAETLQRQGSNTYILGATCPPETHLEAERPDDEFSFYEMHKGEFSGEVEGGDEPIVVVDADCGSHGEALADVAIFRNDSLDFRLLPGYRRLLIEARENTRLAKDFLGHIIPHNHWLPDRSRFLSWIDGFAGEILLAYHQEPFLLVSDANGSFERVTPEIWTRVFAYASTFTAPDGIVLAVPSTPLIGQVLHFRCMHDGGIGAEGDFDQLVLLSRPTIGPAEKDLIRRFGVRHALICPDATMQDGDLIAFWDRFEPPIRTNVLLSARTLTEWLYDVLYDDNDQAQMQPQSLQGLSCRWPIAESETRLTIRSHWKIEVLRWLGHPKRRWEDCESIFSATIADYCNAWYQYTSPPIEVSWARLMKVGCWYTRECRPALCSLLSHLNGSFETEKVLYEAQRLLEGAYEILW